MKRFQTLTTVSCLALLAAFLTPIASADDWDRKTEVTFAAPVEIPGVHLSGWAVLPAGTYVFKILDSQSDRHIVQIFNKEETTVYATILAIPNFRLKATDKTVITFGERPAGAPEALRAWFYPGMNWGEEFVYPKEKAMALAKMANTPVLFTPIDVPVEVTEPIQFANHPLVLTLKSAPLMAIQPTGEEVALAQVVTTPPSPSPTHVEVAPYVASAPQSSLPATASHLPLFALLGLLALGGAFALRLTGKRAV